MMISRRRALLHWSRRPSLTVKQQQNVVLGAPNNDDGPKLTTTRNFSRRPQNINHHSLFNGRGILDKMYLALSERRSKEPPGTTSFLDLHQIITKRNASSNKTPPPDADNSGGEQHQDNSWYYRNLVDQQSLQPPAGELWKKQYPNEQVPDDFIPQISLHLGDGRRRKRILILCTGGTMTMAPDPHQCGALAPVDGALSKYIQDMNELNDNQNMPEIVLHEYHPFYDSSDLGPADWVRLANDIRVNYLVRVVTTIVAPAHAPIHQ
jgi:Asparaginase, N-terminal